jgi:hypothetical protein
VALIIKQNNNKIGVQKGGNTIEKQAEQCLSKISMFFIVK